MKLRRKITEQIARDANEGNYYLHDNAQPHVIANNNSVLNKFK